MPQPEDPGSQGKGKGKKALEFWVNEKGWSAYTFGVGEDASDVIPFDPETHDVVLKGTMFDEDGNTLKDKPHVKISEIDTGAEILLDAPASQAFTILYKIVEEEWNEVQDFDTQDIP